MPGLLDFLQTPEGQGLLSATFGGLAGARRGEPINSIGRAGLAGLGGYTGAQERIGKDADSLAKRKYMQSQIDENDSQNLTRAAALKRSAEQDAYLLGTPSGQPAPATAQATGLLGGAPTSPGAFKPTVDGMGPVMPTPTQAAPTMGKFDEWSQQFKIPKDALISDYRFNGGKGIAAMLEKHGMPDIQVSGNYVYDKNKQGVGYLPSLSTSQDGKTSMVQIGPDGMPVVSAPRGSAETYGMYKDIDAGITSANTPLKVSQPGPDGTPQLTYRRQSDVLGAPTPGYKTEPEMKATVAGAMGADPAAIQREIKSTQNDLMKPLDPKSKVLLQEYLVGLQAQAKRSPVTSSNFAAEPSAGETATAKANESRAVDTAKAGVVRDTADLKKTKTAGEMVAAVDRAMELLKQGPTSSGVGELVDKASNFFGVSNNGAQISSKLDIVSGELLNNVPRMEGPQSDGDRIEYKIQAGRASDRTLPVEQRMAAMSEVKKYQLKYAKYNGDTSEGGATGSFDASSPKGKVFDAPPTANASNKGQRIRDTVTGKVLISNGMQWKAE